MDAELARSAVEGDERVGEPGQTVGIRAVDGVALGWTDELGRVVTTSRPRAWATNEAPMRSSGGSMASRNACIAVVPADGDGVVVAPGSSVMSTPS